MCREELIVLHCSYYYVDANVVVILSLTLLVFSMLIFIAIPSAQPRWLSLILLLWLLLLLLFLWLRLMRSDVVCMVASRHRSVIICIASIIAYC